MSGCGGTVNNIIKKCVSFKFLFFCIIFLNHAHCKSVVCVGRECDIFCRKYAPGGGGKGTPKQNW